MALPGSDFARHEISGCPTVSDISRAPFDPDGYLVESYLILQATSRPQGLEA